MALENNFYMIVGLVKPNSGNIYLDDLKHWLPYVKKEHSRELAT
jgi:ABC-type lipopolysaccharide export system ATPase subunit